ANMVVIGSGNVAWHMITAFSRKKIRILQILGRNEKSSRKLSQVFSVPYTTDPAGLIKDADLYLLAVQDDRIREVASGLHLTDQLLIHTSGFSSLDVLAGASGSTGVIWPLQTFTSGKDTDYGQIPFFIEGSSAAVTGKLSRFAGLVSDRVMITDSPARQKIHLAAVIASNLTNQLYSISASILERQDIPFNVLSPLITETALKAGQQHPLKSQTGPAVRKDLHVIEKHLELLRDDPAFRDIYRLITENIIHQHHKKNE
ncbi:MAG: F420-dependent NADP oxidoreductase, partial [Bacteroidales bacterium]|nr:F420-dependent NADP oxidoreductase [Bacteroidales bacterium]